jgi:integrase
MRQIRGEVTTEEAARVTLQTLGVSAGPEEDVRDVLTRELIFRAEPDRVAGYLAERILAREEEVKSTPARRQELTQARQRWARLIAGAQGTSIKIEEAWKTWKTAPRKKSAADDTVETAYWPIWDRFQKWAVGRGLRHMHDVSPVDATNYLGHLQNEGLSAKTIRNHRGFLVAVWNALRVQAGLSENVWHDVPAPEAVPSERRALSMDELKMLFAAATDPEDHLAIALGLFAALRLGDVAGLQWSSIRLAEGLIVLRPHKTKKYGREVRIPIHASLRELLVRHHEAHHDPQWVCPNLHRLYEGGRANAGRHVRDIFARAGIQLVGDKGGQRRQRAPSLGAFHALRHSFISFAARAGVPQLAVRAIVGHSNATTTRMYEHVDAPTLERAVAAIPVVVSSEHEQ